MVTYCDNLPARMTGWDDNHTLTLFDPTLGYLVGVNLTVDLELVQNFSLENKGQALRNFEADSIAELLITMPNSVSISVKTVGSMSEEAAGFDGVLDYSGPSGKTIEGMTNMSSITLEYANISDFMAQVPGEIISLPASLNLDGETRVPGNSVFIAEAFAGSKICITYTYESKSIQGGDEL